MGLFLGVTGRMCSEFRFWWLTLHGCVSHSEQRSFKAFHRSDSLRRQHVFVCYRCWEALYENWLFLGVFHAAHEPGSSGPACSTLLLSSELLIDEPLVFLDAFTSCSSGPRWPAFWLWFLLNEGFLGCPRDHHGAGGVPVFGFGLQSLCFGKPHKPCSLHLAILTGSGLNFCH